MNSDVMRRQFSAILCLLLIAIGISCGPVARGAHLMGGDLTYKYVGNNRYALKFLIYRDDNCTSCASMPTSIQYYSYAGSYVAKKDYTVFTTHTVKLFSISYVKPDAPNCASPTGVKAQQGIYLDTLTYGSDTVGYHITWFSNGERNGAAILNLEKGGCTPTSKPFSMVWYTFIPANSYKNSTPQFLTVPLPYLCVGQTNYILPNASDPDKDSLVYSLEVPYSPPPCNTGTPTPYPLGHPNFQQVSYASGYSVTDPFGTGSKSISIDPQTGIITATPGKSGAFVIAVQVKEYRYDPVYKKTVYLDFVRRDLEFIVGSGCPTSSPPTFFGGPSSSNIVITPGDSVDFYIGGYAANGTDSVHLSATGGVFQGPNATISSPYATLTASPVLDGPAKVYGHFKWKPGCAQVTYTSAYTVTFALSDQSCHTIYQTVQITVKPRPILTPPLLKCADVTGKSTINLSFSDTGSKPTFLQYKIYRDTGYSGHFVLVDSVNSYTKTSWTDTKATNSKKTVYSYYFTSQNNCGQEGLPSDTISSIVLTLTKVSDKRANITWNAASKHVKNKYKIYRASGTAALVLVDSAPSKRSYSFASCNGTYRFKVQVTDSTGSCISHSGDTVSVILSDVTAPNADSNLVNATAVSNTSIKLTITASDSNDTKYYYIVRHDANNNTTTIDSIKHVKGQKQYIYYDNKVTFKGITKAEQITYEVIPADSCKNAAVGGNIYFGTIAGTAGQLQNSVSWVQQSWIHHSVSNGPRLTYVQRNTGSGWVTILTNPGTASYTDNNLTCNKNYQYRLFEIDNSGDTALSNVITLTPFDTVKPATPKVWYATAAKNHKVYITWSRSSTKVKQYIIFRKAANETNFKAIDTVSKDTFFTDASAQADKMQYCYEVQAMDSCAHNLSAVSGPHCEMLLGSLAPGCVQKLVLGWTYYSGWTNGVAKYEVYKKTDNGAPVLLTATTAAIDTFTDLNVTNKHIYTYYIKAYEKNGTGTSYSDSSVNSPFKPPTPYIMYASKTVTSATAGTVVVRWKSQKTPNIKFSRLYYRAYGSSSFTLLKDNILPGVDSFVHKNLNTNTADHEYFMISYDSCGNVSDTSLVHKTMDLNITVGQLVHYVEWTPYEGWPVRRYDLQMMISGKFVTVDTVAGNDTFKRRFPAPCNSAIYYRILARSYNGDVAISDTAGAKAIDTIPSNKPTMFYAGNYDYTDNVIAFRGSDSSDTYGYYILRSDGGGAYNTIGFYPFFFPGDTIPLLDSVATTDMQHCYVVVTVDSCLNASASDTFCPVFLKGTAQNQAALLQFTPFKGFDILEYHLETWVNNAWQVLAIKKKPKDTAYFQAPLACYVPRYYRVVAYENGGSNYYTISESIRVVPFDTVVPNAPVLYSAAAVPGTGYRLAWHWDKTTDVKYFDIYRGDSTSAPVYLATVTYDSTYTDAIKPVNNKYKYYIIAIDSCDNSHRSKPSLTQQTIKVSIDNNGCTAREILRWSSYKGFPDGVKSYNIYKTAAGGGRVLLASVSTATQSYTDNSVSVGTRYTYQVEAVDSAGKYTSLSDTISGVPFIYTVPVAVQIKRATVLKTAANGSILIEWNSLDLTDPYASGYRLYYATTAGGPFTLLHDEANTTVTSYVHTGVNTLTSSFYYYIAPYNICNKEGIASAVHHSMNMQVANTNLKATISWNKYQGFTVDHYMIYKAVGNASFNPVFRIAATDSMYADTNVYCGRQYTYQVYAYDKNSKEVAASDSMTITAFDTSAPAKAYIYSASVSKTDPRLGQIILNFQTAADKNRKGYVVYRSQNGGPFASVDTFLYTNTGIYQYFDDALNTDVYTYAYYMRTIDSCGNVAAAPDTHMVVHLDAVANNNFNALTWSGYQGFSSYDYVIYRKAGTGAWNRLAVLDSSITAYTDNKVQCHVFYTYRILTRNKLTGDSSYSNTDTATAFKTTPPFAPHIINTTVTVTSNTLGRIFISWKPSYTPDVATYLIYRRNDNTPWQLIAKTGPFSSTYTDIDLNTHYWPYYYKVLCVDSCGNTCTDSSQYHRTVNLNAKPADQVVDLNWNTYWGYKVFRYELYKDGKLFRIFDSTTTTFPDSFVMCPNLYHYVIKAIGNDTASWSNRDSAAPIDTTPPLPPVMKTVTVRVPNSLVDIVWVPTTSGDAKGYRLYRKVGTGANELIYDALGFDSIYTDTLSLKGEPVCYEIYAYDHCGNSSGPSAQGCVINMKGSVKSAEHNLQWNAYQYWPDDVDYYLVYRREDNGNWTKIAQVQPSGLQYVDKDLSELTRDFCYRVEAVEKKGGLNAQSWSTVVCLTQPPVVWVPNAFTPQYSFNLNDFFGPKGIYFKQYNMRIFNRWGETVFETTDSQAWDGNYKGQPAPDGVYLYQIDVQGYNGNTYTFKGTVSIVK